MSNKAYGLFIFAVFGLVNICNAERSSTVLTMGNNTLIDGCTITGASQNGIYGEGVDFTVNNCVIEDNWRYGVFSGNGDIIIKWCKISNNEFDGIIHQGGGYELIVENSWIMRNNRYGVECINSTPIIKNSIISESDLSETGRAGISIINPSYPPIIYNCTISNNKSEGIFFTDDKDINGDPNLSALDWPDLQNSIVYYNNQGGNQVAGFSVDLYAAYCCIEDCNEPGTANYNDEPGFAYVVDPNTIPDPNNYHLAHNSFCIDKANPILSYAGQVDIDGEGLNRMYGSYVDIGADEVYDCEDDYLSELDVHNDYDWDADGIVNLNEFNEFSKAWLACEPNSPGVTDPDMSANWDAKCNLETFYSPYEINIYDLIKYIDQDGDNVNDNWLWIACWKLEQLNATETVVGETLAVPEQTMMAVPMETMALRSAAVPTSENEFDSIEETLNFLNNIWEHNPDVREAIDQQDWDDFIESIETSLYELGAGF